MSLAYGLNDGVSSISGMSSRFVGAVRDHLGLLDQRHVLVRKLLHGFCPTVGRKKIPEKPLR
jgi:hypothetical protein